MSIATELLGRDSLSVTATFKLLLFLKQNLWNTNN